MKARNLLIPSALICGSLLGLAWHSEAQTYSTPANTATRTFERVGKITGSRVVDASGQAVGQIQDLIANTRNGNIDFAIISLNTPENRGMYTAVPWPLLRTSGANTFTLNTGRDTLRTATTFPADRYPDFSQPNYAQQLYSHYGLSWPAGQTARGGYIPAQEGTVYGRDYYDDTRPWKRPQPDGRETFPWLHHQDQP